MLKIYAISRVVSETESNKTIGFGLFDVDARKFMTVAYKQLAELMQKHQVSIENLSVNKDGYIACTTANIEDMPIIDSHGNLLVSMYNCNNLGILYANIVNNEIIYTVATHNDIAGEYTYQYAEKTPFWNAEIERPGYIQFKKKTGRLPDMQSLVTANNNQLAVNKERISTFDRNTLTMIRNEMKKAFQQIENNFGVSLQAGNITYSVDGTSFHCRVDGSIVLSGKKAGQENFEKHCRMHGFQPSDFGRQFNYKGSTYEICGINERAKKYPMQARKVTDENYVCDFTEDFLKTLLK